MLEIKHISKTLQEFSLKDISFQVKEGDYFVLLGKSGAGKSLVLEIIAGLMEPDNGEITYQQNTLPKNHPIKFGLVFQDFALFPHLTVYENIAFPLKKHHLKKTEIKETVEKLGKEMSIDHLLLRKPDSLSGGEQQRVALARTLALRPDILLLDEPLSSLDIQLRDGLRALLRKLNKKGQTIIHVTHDFQEAVSLASRVAVMEQGRIIQQGTPSEVFQHPESDFVATFVGIRNFFRVKVRKEADGHSAYTKESFSIRLLSNIACGIGTVLIRSKDITITREKPVNSTAQNIFNGKIKEIVPLRQGLEVWVDTGVLFAAHITKESLERLQLDENMEVWISFKASAVKFVKA